MKLPLITTGMICFLGICNFAQATVSPTGHASFLMLRIKAQRFA